MNEPVSNDDKDEIIKELEGEIAELKDIIDDYRRWVRKCPE